MLEICVRVVRIVMLIFNIIFFHVTKEFLKVQILSTY